MQDYTEFAEKNGITLNDEGPCQFCGANTARGIHECLDIFNIGFQSIDYSKIENHKYRFFIVDAHALQHPEIHGRWSNHFHLTRLHLISHYKIKWSYGLSPQLSDHLNLYKKENQDEKLIAPELLNRGKITTSDVQKKAQNEIESKTIIESWAREVYDAWKNNLPTIDLIAKGFTNL